MPVSEQLPHCRFRPGRTARNQLGDETHPQQLLHLRFDEELHQALTQPRIVQSVAAGEVHQVGGGGTHPPHHPALGEAEPLVAQGELCQAPPPVHLPDEVAGGDAGVAEEHLAEALLPGHLPDGPHLYPLLADGAEEVADAPMLGGLGVGAGEEDAVVGAVCVAGPDLLAVHHPLVAVELGAGSERGEVRAGVGLAEELAPDLLAPQQRPKEALPLPVAPGGEDGGRRPPDPDGVVRPRVDSGPVELLVDDQPVLGVGVPAPRGREPRCHQAGVGQLGGGGLGVLGEPGTHLHPAGVVFRGQAQVHARASLPRPSWGP